MTYVRVPGSFWAPWAPWDDIELSPAMGANILNATGAKYAYIGRVWTTDRSSKLITKVGIAISSFLTKTSTSKWTLSLQNVSTSAGDPSRPDGTQDQTVTISSTDATLGANSMYWTQALSASRAVSYGELIAVVVEFSSEGRQGSDEISFGGLNNINSDTTNISGGLVLGSTDGTTWTRVNRCKNLAFEFTDGSVGNLDFFSTPGLPTTNFNSLNQTTSSGSGGDEVGIRFVLPFTCKVDGGHFIVRPSNSSANFNIVLYQGTTALVTSSFYAIQNTQSVGTTRANEFSFTEQTLTAGTEYVLAVKPTTDNDVIVYKIGSSATSVSSNLAANFASSNFYWASRTDGGAWDFDTSYQPFMGIRISAVDDGTSANVQSFSVSNVTTLVSDRRGSP